jgi:hypothetical protein
MRKRQASLFVALLALTLVTTAFAGDDDESGPGHYRAHVIVIYGRPDRPNVQILLKTPTAAAAASEAHASLHAALWAAHQPVQR